MQYCFQESEPDSLPPPVCFSPPNAPPISKSKSNEIYMWELLKSKEIITNELPAPDGDVLTLTKPQSDPFGPIH